jgi:hypothetical protein
MRCPKSRKSEVGQDGLERVIAYASRSNSSSERNYASYKGEMLAAVWGVDYFKYWLTGRPFKLITDHQPLAWLMKNDKLTGIYFRWAARLSEFDLEIVYRPGSANVADMPSPHEAVAYGDRCWSKVLVGWEKWRAEGLTEHRNWWPELYREHCEKHALAMDPAVAAYGVSYASVRADLKDISASA